ncbi:prepilin-type N-terminal cleavage/methylation domain-containing protein [Stenotrophomonas sp. SY1]|jgi:prepilin-type N-terminal cleavage/methylation domain-containing protein|uniref:prepilin-type N-terminal cleavage/methylation domain-containing protein n=1 Tax=Stenotrophomonas sp. SY1 TaxID=477235 RepID=UPI001E3D6D50|nr:prepilin-type N-terminal cleavage/methylation domain-containing protein [Stenotrophomonas sp. SY1]MCD9088309.1 prepilin-type N-terminal cleavage/methylation domain-containing protein [Stenotrophomonas sp. SY1]
MSRRVAGFSLVELMVTLAVIAVLAAAGTPFARSWIDSNRQMQARNVMWEAVSQTRAIALRNPGQVAGDDASARLQRDGRTLQVLNTDDAVLWTGQLPANAAIKHIDATDFSDAAALQASADELSCVAFGNRGQRLPAAAGCSSAAGSYRLAIGLNDQEPLYVDLL